VDPQNQSVFPSASNGGQRTRVGVSAGDPPPNSGPALLCERVGAPPWEGRSFHEFHPAGGAKLSPCRRGGKPNGAGFSDE